MTYYENIPEELKKLPQWVCAFSYSKAPRMAAANAPASSIDPKTWSDFDTARQAVQKGYYDYCGFVFNNNGLVGVDIDAGVDEDGFITPTAAKIIGMCESYTERSKSGRGFHIILKGQLPFRGRNNRSGVEIYQAARYFILTGKTVLFQTISANQTAIDKLLDAFFQQEQKTGAHVSEHKIYSPIWLTGEKNRVKVRPFYPKIPVGCRNISLTSLAGSLHNQGYSKRQIFDELRYCNQVACTPPLDLNEVQAICNSVTRYNRQR